MSVFPSESPFRLPSRIEPSPEAREAFEASRRAKVEGGPKGLAAPTFRDSLEQVRAAVEEAQAGVLDYEALVEQVGDVIANSGLDRG